MNIREDLTNLLMESYDRGVEDAKQAAIEGIQKAILLEREACAQICEGRNRDGDWFAAEIRARGQA